MRTAFIVCLFVLADLPWRLVLGQVAQTDTQTTTKASPVGRWKTVDDVSGKAKSVVVIWGENGKLFGRIEKLVGQEAHDPDPRCARCVGDLKGRPLIGLRILWDLQKGSRVQGVCSMTFVGRPGSFGLTPLKGRPLIGLRILWDLQKGSDQWSGGKILDPDNGKIYKCSISLDGKKLKVRGFIGFSLLGRTQYWLRED